MAPHKRTARPGQSRENRSTISGESVLYAGLGALHEETPHRFRELCDLGRAVSKTKCEVFEVPRAVAYRSQSMEPVIESMMPETIPTPAMVLQARRNSAARTELIEEFGLLTSGEIGELNQSQAANRSALASRWKGEGKIFSVTHQGRDYFPGFQFQSDGRPLPIVASILEALVDSRGWEIALWFTGSNGYLDGRRPVDLLTDEPEAVVGAAQHEAEEIFF